MFLLWRSTVNILAKVSYFFLPFISLFCTVGQNINCFWKFKDFIYLSDSDYFRVVCPSSLSW